MFAAYLDRKASMTVISDFHIVMIFEPLSFQFAGLW
jgi:hypothetical protein